MLLRVDYIGSCNKLPRSPFKILYSYCQLSGVLLVDGWVLPQKLSSGEESCLVNVFSPSIGADCIQWLICMETKSHPSYIIQDISEFFSIWTPCEISRNFVATTLNLTSLCAPNGLHLFLQTPLSKKFSAHKAPSQRLFPEEPDIRKWIWESNSGLL